MNTAETQPSQIDISVFETTPGLNVLLRPSTYSVISISNDFLLVLGRTRDRVVGMDFISLMGETSYAIDGNALKASLDEVAMHKRVNEIIGDYGLSANGQTARLFLKVRNIPVLDQSGDTSCIICAVTQVINEEPRRQPSASIGTIEDAYQFFMKAPVIIGYLRGADYVIEFANERLRSVWDRSREVVGQPLFDAFPELRDQGTRALLDEVRRTGKPFFAYEYPLHFDRNGKTDTFYFDFIYQAYYETADRSVATGVISVGHDVTEQVRLRNRFTNVIEQANDPIAIFKGKDMILEVANEAVYKLANIDRSAIGKPFSEIFPNATEQIFLEKLGDVYDSGKSFYGYEVPVEMGKGDEKKTVYFNFTYQAYREPDGAISGVLGIASDVTSHVLVKKQAEESQKKWKELANSMPVMVWTADNSGRVDFLNDQWYQFTGLTENESLGFGWISVLHPDDLQRCGSIWRQALENEVLYEVEVRYKRKDGEYRWAIARGIPIKHEGDIAWYGTSTDIHERKQLELLLEEKVRERTDELEDKNKLLDNILRNSSNGISVSEMIFDDESNVVDAITILANDAAVRYSGLPAEIYLTKKVTELDPGILASAYGLKCIETLRTGEPFLMQYYLDFSARWLEVTVSKMDDSHLIHIFTDVTAVKQAQLDLEKSLEDLQYANTNLEEFAYAASHDLKEPIRKIQFFANRLKADLDEKLDDKQRQLFERLENSGLRMADLIDDLLEYSQAAKGSAQQEEIELDEVLSNVLEDLDLEIHAKQAKITFNRLPVIRGNKRQIHQLFQNLISNGLKYSRTEVHPQISIASSVVSEKEIRQELPLAAGDKKFYMIEVSDNGIGFEQRFADKIFNVFTRLHSDPKYRGSGIGLAIVKKVVESHQGYIWAEGKPGVGSVFTILFPK